MFTKIIPIDVRNYSFLMITEGVLKFYLKYAVCILYKMENLKYQTIGKIPKLNIKIVERGKIDTHNTQST